MLFKEHAMHKRGLCRHAVPVFYFMYVFSFNKHL